ncbi:MAG: type IV secretion system protein [Alphaproteobacteria bacterium]|nr:type IV secretion system protein [Alphaproteobacteria bacterium]
MAQLGNGIKKVLLTNGKAQNKQGPDIHFIEDSDAAETSSKETYFRWVSRLVLLCAILSLAFFLSASLVIFRLAPEIITEPLLIIRQDESSKMVRYEPMTKDMPSLRQLTEMYIKQYISLRNTVINDMTEMKTRWAPGGIVYYLSAIDVYRDFIGQNAESIDKMFDKGYSSEVRIDEMEKESENSPAWRVKFTVFNLSQERGSSGALILKTKKYRASITPKFISQRKLVRARLINPLGFTVIKYNQSEIKE